MAINLFQTEHSARTVRAEPSQMSRSNTPQRDIRLPVELWLEILPYLPLSAIREVTRTCSALRSLAQPLLFKFFIVRADAPVIRQEAYQSHRRARLSVLASPHIANAIQELRIHMAPQPSSGLHSRATQRPAPRPVDDIIDIIFNALPSLTNLKKLVCNHVVFTRGRLLSMRHLPLKALELQSCSSSCSADEFPDLSTLPLETLIFDYPFSHRGCFGNARFLSLFLRSRRLQHIYAGPANDIIFAITKAKHLNSLSVLEMPVSCVASPVFIPALSCCSSLEEIHLHMVPGSNQLPAMDAIPPEILPILKSYHGPRVYAPLFTRDRAVEHIEFSLSCKPDDLTDTILGLDADLESLACKVNHLNAPLLRTIHTSFPALQHLAISGVDLEFHSLDAILKKVDAHHGITSIQLNVQMGLPRLTSSWRAIAARMFLTRLIQAYPFLETARLIYQPETSIMWRRPASVARAYAVDAAELWIEKHDDTSNKTRNIWDIIKR